MEKHQRLLVTKVKPADEKNRRLFNGAEADWSEELVESWAKYKNSFNKYKTKMWKDKWELLNSILESLNDLDQAEWYSNLPS